MDLIVEQKDESGVWLRCEGEVNQDWTSACGDALRDQVGADVYSQPVGIDLSTATRMDSSGISWLLSCHRRFREHGGRMILHSLPPEVSNILRVLRLHQTFEIASTRTQAAKMFAGGAS